MRLLAKTLIVLLVTVSLALPKTMGRGHEVACDASDVCEVLGVGECSDADPCDGCPPPEDCPCDHGGDQDELPLQQDGEDDRCPAHQHHHHHHHTCVCSAANAWLISDSNLLSLHPPLQGHVLAPREMLAAPESPVYLLDRPPMA
ncbi:MAG: hypothetical protein VCA73_03175 [Roseibacillus sp.]